MKKLFFTAALALAACTEIVNAQSGAPLFTSPIGVQAYTYRDSWGKGVAPVLDTLKSLGITEVEGPGPKIVSPEEFKTLAAARGITIPSIGADYNMLKTDIYDIIGLAKTFGATYVMCAWIPHGNTFTI